MSDDITELPNEMLGVQAATLARLFGATDEQIIEWNLPTRPDKKDGREVVELDGIPPDRLVALVDDAIIGMVDVDAWEKEQAAEASERLTLERMVKAS